MYRMNGLGAALPSQFVVRHMQERGSEGAFGGELLLTRYARTNIMLFGWAISSRLASDPNCPGHPHAPPAATYPHPYTSHPGTGGDGHTGKEVTSEEATEEPAPQPAAVTDIMIEVPAGSFTMGSDDADPEDAPAQQVDLPAYAIDRFEVTNADFDAFVQETGYETYAEWQWWLVRLRTTVHDLQPQCSRSRQDGQLRSGLPLRASRW